MPQHISQGNGSMQNPEGHVSYYTRCKITIINWWEVQKLNKH